MLVNVANFANDTNNDVVFPDSSTDSNCSLSLTGNTVVNAANGGTQPAQGTFSVVDADKWIIDYSGYPASEECELISVEVMFTCGACDCTDTGWVVFHPCPAIDVVAQGDNDFVFTFQSTGWNVTAEKDGMTFTNLFDGYSNDHAGGNQAAADIAAWFSANFGGTWDIVNANDGSSQMIARIRFNGVTGTTCIPDSIASSAVNPLGALETLDGFVLPSGFAIPDDCCTTVDMTQACVPATGGGNCLNGSIDCSASPQAQFDFQSNLFNGANATPEQSALLSLFGDHMNPFSMSWTGNETLGYSINGSGASVGYSLTVTWDWSVSPGPAVFVQVRNAVGQKILDWSKRGICVAPYDCDLANRVSFASPNIDTNGNVVGGEEFRVVINPTIGTPIQC